MRDNAANKQYQLKVGRKTMFPNARLGSCVETLWCPAVAWG
jgi:hypothetical protein